MIYEGTNGIQALDLVGRKLASNGGRAVFSFFAELDDFIGTAGDDAELKPFIEGLSTARAQLQEGTTWLMQNGMSDFNNAGASSHDYLHLFGLTALTYMWARMAKVAIEKKADGEPVLCREAADRPILPRPYVAGRRCASRQGQDRRQSTMALTADQF